MKIRSTLILLSLVLGLMSCSYNSGVLKEAQPATPQTTNLKATTDSSVSGVHLWIRGVDNTQFVAGGGILVHVDLIQKGNPKSGDKRVAIFDSTWNGPEHFNDLLSMNSGIMLDLSDGEVNPPPGNYDYAVATVVPGSGWIEAKDGKKYTVKFPGNKFKLAFKPSMQITTMVSLDVVLNIDVSRSFVKTGNSYIFKPVVQVVNATTAGTLTGGVVDASTYQPIFGAYVYLLDDNGTEYGPVQTLAAPYVDPTTGLTLQAGQYYFPGIPAGTYTAYAEENGYATAEAPVTIVKGNFTEQNFMLTPQ